MMNEKDMLNQIANGQLTLPPLNFRLIQTEPEIGGKSSYDALVEVSWKNNKAKFLVEFKSLSTPKVFQNAVNYVKTLTRGNNYLPMIVMPFLSPDYS